MTAQIIPIRDNIQSQPSIEFCRGMCLMNTLMQKFGANHWQIEGLKTMVAKEMITSEEAKYAYILMGFKGELGE